MLVVNLEINGFNVGQAIVHNDGTGDNLIGNYKYWLDRVNEDSVIKKYHGSIKNFDRRRGAWALVKEILEDAGL